MPEEEQHGNMCFNQEYVSKQLLAMNDLWVPASLGELERVDEEIKKVELPPTVFLSLKVKGTYNGKQVYLEMKWAEHTPMSLKGDGWG